MTSVPVRAMVLAAGLGTRLRPLTERVPKPLLPVAGRPLLGRVIERLRAAGVEEIAVNTHHLAGEVEAFVRSLPDAEGLRVFHEPEILGTGGALANARTFLAASESFLLHNSDVVTDADPGALLDAHRDAGALATLLVTEHAPENKVLVAPDGTVLDILGRLDADAPAGGRLLTYTGLAAFSPVFFEFLPTEGCSSLVDALLAAVSARPGSVRALAPEALEWSDLGTLAEYAAALPVVRERGLGKGLSAEPLAEQGSDRVFLRLRAGEESAVLMLSPPGDADLDRYLDIGAFLSARDLGTPEILAADRADRAVILEDLGGRSLYAFAREERDASKIEAVYRKVLDLLVAFQVRGTRDLDACPAAATRALDAKGLRWETEYFRTQFLERYAGIDARETAELEREFARLTEAVAAQPQVLIHRDFQSQNILIKDGRVRLLDFQGARRGPLAYDLVSLLKDPYVELPHAMRNRLTEHHRIRLAAEGGPEVEAAQHAAWLLAAGLQRNMQALGAYAFLSLEKRRATFREFMEPGLRLLAEGLAEMEASGAVPGPLSRLTDLISKLIMRY